jgi:hypothetical protein
VTVLTPKLLARRQSIQESNNSQPTDLFKEIELSVSFKHLTLTVSLPVDYPTYEPPAVTTTKAADGDTIFAWIDEHWSVNSQGILRQLFSFAFSEKLSAVTSASSTTTSSTTTSSHCYVAKFNHLLHGPAHKKEAELASLLKSYSFARGAAIIYGTPGLVVVRDENESEIRAFGDECSRNVGKRCDDVIEIQDSTGAADGFFENGGKVCTRTVDELKSSFGDAVMKVILGI